MIAISISRRLFRGSQAIVLSSILFVGLIAAEGADSQDRNASATAAEPSNACWSPSPGQRICMTFDASAGADRDLLVRSGVAALQAVHSPQFAADLETVIRTQAQADSPGPWRGVHAAEIVPRLQAAMSGMQVTTYGGLYGWWLKLAFGNLAFDGGAGPVRLNRFGLPRSEASIANTYVHEAAHRIGLTHPDRSGRACTPPYVIGSLIEKEVMGADWRPERADCPVVRALG